MLFIYAIQVEIGIRRKWQTDFFHLLIKDYCQIIVLAHILPVWKTMH